MGEGSRFGPRPAGEGAPAPPPTDQSAGDGVLDDGDLEENSGEEEQEIISADDGRGASAPAVATSSRSHFRPQGRLFARGASGGGFWLNLGSTAIALGVVAVCAGIVAGMWYGGRLGWRHLRPHLDAAGYPFAAHRCATSATGDPLMSGLADLFRQGEIRPVVREAVSRGEVLQMAGRGARRVSAGGATVLVVQDPLGPAGVGIVAIAFTKKQSFCAVLDSLGFPGGDYSVDKEGTLRGPVPAGLQVRVAPRRGRITEVRLLPAQQS